MNTVLRRRTQVLLVSPPDTDAPDIPVRVQLTYDPTAPYVVTARFRTGPDSDVVWELARELLAAGLLERAGDGDVQIAPMPDRLGCVRLRLESPSGLAVFAVRVRVLREFLTRTYALVPAGTEMEHIDLDGWLERVLDDAAERS